jgi:O-antigen ligase
MTAQFRRRHEDVVRALVWVPGVPVLMVAIAWLFPSMLPDLVGALLAASALVLAYRHLTLAWVAWLIATGMSLEMTLNDLIGPEAFQITIAAVKGTEIGLSGLLLLRFGMARDVFNPAWGFAAMATTGVVAGVHPDMSAADMVRSLIGSVTPFLLFFCRKPPGWGQTILRAVACVPVISVVLGSILDLAGIRPLFVDSGGIRLEALGHPAFLAGVCLPSIYAGLLHWLRTASPRSALLMGANLMILFLTGARAPIAYCALVIAISLAFAPEAAVPRAHRLVIITAGFACVPILLFLGEAYGSLRLFSLLAGDSGSDLSGRQLLWPAFEAASAQAPWFGWGLGAGNFILPHEGQVAQMLKTWAAHNEYLRIQVEGGYIGRSLLIFLFVAWVTTHTRRLPPMERMVMRVIFLAHALHAMTDNVLISTPACVFFAFVAAVFGQVPQTADSRGSSELAATALASRRRVRPNVVRGEDDRKAA